MRVYWKEATNKVIDKDKYENPIYETRECFGELVGSFATEGGTSQYYLVVAMTDGSFKNVQMGKCYHKENIYDDNTVMGIGKYSV